MLFLVLDPIRCSDNEASIVDSLDHAVPLGLPQLTSKPVGHVEQQTGVFALRQGLDQPPSYFHQLYVAHHPARRPQQALEDTALDVAKGEVLAMAQGLGASKVND